MLQYLNMIVRCLHIMLAKKIFSPISFIANWNIYDADDYPKNLIIVAIVFQRFRLNNTLLS